jgi:protein O-GlcNAc transferase
MAVSTAIIHVSKREQIHAYGWLMSAMIDRKLQQASTRLRAGDIASAETLLGEVLRQAPRHPGALCLLGVARLMSGSASDAVAPLQQALATDPHYGMAAEHLGLAHLQLGQFADAERVLRQAARLQGAPASVFMRLGAALIHQGKPTEAVPVLQRALALAPDDIESHLNLGQALAHSAQLPAAQQHFETVLRLAPDHVDALFNLGVLALGRDDLDGAGQWFERVLARAPKHVDACINLGIVLQKRSLFDEASARFQQALAIDPLSAAAGNDLAHTRALQGWLEEAREQYLATLRVAPRYAVAQEGLGTVCLALGRVSEAIEHLQSALQSEPDNRNALATLASALFEAGKLDDAEATAQRVCALDAAAPGAYATLANIHFVRGDLDRAIATLDAGYAQSGASGLLGMLTYQLRQACAWTPWQTAWNNMAPQLEQSATLGSPFWLLCEPISAAQQLDYTRRWAAARFKSITPPALEEMPSSRPHRRLRIGYLSSDLQEHAAAYLVADVLEQHDRERFEVFAYSHGPDDHSAMRQRLRAACEHFVDIAREPDDTAAQRIRADTLDILVDLKGYTVGDRLSIMARRPCAVQVTWLGYPGTTGAAFMDYLIADAFIIPPDAESAYSERIARLPHCYQPNDRKRAIAETLPRTAYGLPDHAFVYCCFNQAYKITPDIFAVWMRLLQARPDSVLWLVESHALAKRNLIAAARAHNVPAEKLVFAPRLPYAEHLARYRAADLVLDTFPYTSHTIMSDALWCGCPAVSLCGDTFAARVSGSILSAAGLADLVTYSIADYEQLAARLAADAALLREVRERVAHARDHSALFDSAAFTRSLEQIYTALASRPRSS